MRLEVAFCAALLALFACCKRSDSYKVEATFQPLPPREGPLSVSLHISDSAARPVESAKIDLEGDMTHAGMAPVFGTAKELAAGNYQGILQLTMAGDWMVLVHAHLAGGTVLERGIPVK